MPGVTSDRPRPLTSDETAWAGRPNKRRFYRAISDENTSARTTPAHPWPS